MNLFQARIQAWNVVTGESFFLVETSTSPSLPIDMRVLLSCREITGAGINSSNSTNSRLMIFATSLGVMLGNFCSALACGAYASGAKETLMTSSCGW